MFGVGIIDLKDKEIKPNLPTHSISQTVSMHRCRPKGRVHLLSLILDCNICVLKNAFLQKKITLRPPGIFTSWN